MGEIRRRHPEKIKQNPPNNSSKKGGNNRHFVVKVFIPCLIVITFLFVYNRNFYSSQNEQLRKSDLPDALIEDIYNQTNWGTFRPQLYFGMKMKHPNSPLFGLLWYKQPHEEIFYDLPIRHWCEHGDNVRFSWLAHDGKSFGRQQIVDRSLEFEIDWIGTEQNSWTASFNGNSGNDSYAFVFYMTKQDASNILNPKNQMLDSNHFSFISGSSPEIGHYKIYIRSNNIAAGKISSIAYLIQPELDLSQINKLILYSLTRPHQSNGQLILYQNDRIPGPESDNANFVAVQFTIKGKFNLFVDFTANDAEPMLDFNSKFAIKLREFDEKFDQVFPIDSSNLISPDIKKYTKMAKTALSSLLGGIGAWHGFAFVKTPGNQLVQDYGPLSLFSAVPSRPFFPRGFLWDEGFHNLVIRQFNPELSLQILGSWLNTMNSEGWIPREIILGKEAEAKVPNEFLVQSTSVANPPVFFYVLEKFVRNSEQFKRHYSQIEKLYPRLKQFYIWLRTTQQGQGLHGTMQWQGRNRTTDRELNPKILPSGLDDFPRATHPSSEEFHLDLRCWIAFSSRILRQLAEIFGDSHWVPIIEEDVRLFNNIDVLNRLHWSEEKQRYSDFGLHSEKVNLVKVVAKTFDNHGSASQPEYIFVRKTMEKPKLRLVDDVFGYVNIFPLLLRLLPPNDPKLNILLHSLNKTEDLWTSYGLRSLSTRSPYYRARNTEHDPPYWRGAIWININYLALDALNYYTKSGGPYARLAGNIYEELRQNIMRNIAEQFDKTGFFWEHYDDKTGEGMGTRPFTGWTSLVLNIVAEKFD